MTDRFQDYGQNETLISSIRNIIKDYPHQSVFKEFLQNADDAKATQFHVIIDTRSHPTNSLLHNDMRVWQGPAILMFNNAKFREPDDFTSLMQIRVGGKQDDDTKIGKHGIGFNSCYHFTDAPSFISGDSFAFLDPQEKYLHKLGTLGSIPKNGLNGFPEKDQLVPFEGIEGIDFRSTFNGTLFRLPLRREPSEISDVVFTTNDITNLFDGFKSNISSQFIFLRHIETIKTSCITETTIPLRITPRWEANTIELDESVRTKRKYINNGEFQTFQLKIKLISNPGNGQSEQNDHWVIANGAQQNPEDLQMRRYADRYRLRLLGGAAALLNSNLSGRMYCFFPLPDVTHLPFHLNGTWAQGSDRGRLLIENDNLPDIDYQKLNWNRHILLDFLPKVYCKLLHEIISLHKGRIISLTQHPISKYWPFLSNSPKYVLEYSFRAIQTVLQDNDIFQLINDDNLPDNERNRVETFFKFLSKEQIPQLVQFVRSMWNELRSNSSLMSMVRSLPIWLTFSGSYKSVSCGGYLLHNNLNYRTRKDSKIYFYHSLPSYDKLVSTEQILTQLGVTYRDYHSYAMEDVDFPDECDSGYVNFLNNILADNRTVQNLRTRRCFPTLTSKNLKKIDKLFNYKVEIFRIVFNGSPDLFLHDKLSPHSCRLSSIGFKDKVNGEIFIECARYIRDLHNRVNRPADIRHRGLSLINYFYNNNLQFNNLGEMTRYQFIPISRDLGKPYSFKYSRSQVLDCFDNAILPKYKEVAWSQKSLIAEDVIPPQHIINKYPSLGKPEVSIVIEHLNYLYYTLRVDNEWKNWASVFKNNVYYVYGWLEEECKNDEELFLSELIQDSPLFLNFNEDQDPFNENNWVSANGLVLNSEPDEKKYVNPSLSKYSVMLKRSGVNKITRPDIQINVRAYEQQNINSNTLNTLFNFLSNQEFSLNDITFTVNGENIKANRYMLAASSEWFCRRFTSELNETTITINDINSNSLRILLRYLYGENIDNSIIKVSGNTDQSNQSINFELYKDLLKLADIYELDHLKELMELRLSRLVVRSNMEVLKTFAETSRAEQLKTFCNRFIEINRNV